MTDSIKLSDFHQFSNLPPEQMVLSRSRYLGRLKVKFGEGGNAKTFYGSDLIKKGLKQVKPEQAGDINAGLILAKLSLMDAPKAKGLARIFQAVANFFSPDQFRKIHHKKDLILSALGESNYKLVVLQAVQNNPKALLYAADSLRNDPDFIRDAITMNPQALFYAADALRADRDFMLDVIQHRNPKAFAYAGEELKADEEFVMEAIDLNPAVAEFAVSENGLLLADLDEELRNNPTIARKAVEQNPLALEFVGDDLKRDSELVLLAVQKDGLALQFASLRVQNKKEIVTAAVRQNGLALEFATEPLRNDRDIARIAIAQNPNAVEFIGDNIKSEFVS